MSDFFRKHRQADPEAAEEGVWVRGAYGGLLDLKVRRVNSRKAQGVLRRLNKPYRNMRTIPPETQDKINRQWVAEAILIDWRAAEGAEEAPPPFSQDVALQAFEDDPDFLEEVVGFANEAETFRAERLEAEGKSSATSTSGSSSTGSTSKSSSTD